MLSCSWVGQVRQARKKLSPTTGTLKPPHLVQKRALVFIFCGKYLYHNHQDSWLLSKWYFFKEQLLLRKKEMHIYKYKLSNDFLWTSQILCLTLHPGDDFDNLTVPYCSRGWLEGSQHSCANRPFTINFPLLTLCLSFSNCEQTILTKKLYTNMYGLFDNWLAIDGGLKVNTAAPAVRCKTGFSLQVFNYPRSKGHTLHKQSGNI